jgi:hypothetical protein
MRRTAEVSLQKSEVNHLLSLIESNEERGEYTAPESLYWDRSYRIKKKLTNMNFNRKNEF